MRGIRRGAAILLRCEVCGEEWLRDPDVCPRCGGRTMTDRREPLVQKARGTQQSIVGYWIVRECYACAEAS